MAQLLDVGMAVATNTLSSGYAEKGILVLVSAGTAALMWTDTADEDESWARLRSFLRAMAGIGFAFVGLNKTNADFLNPALSCSVNLMAELTDQIPFARPFASLGSGSPWISWLAEVMLLPLLLLFPRIGPLYVWSFFMAVALVGPRATCLVFMALSLAFLPTTDFSRLVLHDQSGKSGQSDRDGRRFGWICGGAFFVAALFWMINLEEARRFAPTQLVSRVGFLTLCLTGIVLMAANALHQSLREPPAPSPFQSGRRSVRIVAITFIGLLLLNEFSPYLGLKTKYSLTMWSNLRTDAARWNSLVIPEFVRVSERADRALLRVTKIRPIDPNAAPLLPNGKRARGLRPFVASHSTAQKQLRRMEEGVGPLRIELVMGEQLFSFEGPGEGSEFDRFIARTQPRIDWFDERVMTLNRGQRCLGP